MELYRERLREMPNEPRLHLDPGLALEKAGQPTAAIPELEFVTWAQPKMAGAWFLLGLAYVQLKRPVDAIGPLRPDPSNSQALLELADAEMSSGDSAGAARDFGEFSCSASPRTCLERKGDFSAVLAHADPHSAEQLYLIALAAGERAPLPESHESCIARANTISIRDRFRFR